MKIGIISDTHIKNNMEQLQDFLAKNLVEMDMIIHTGDFISVKAFEILKDYKEFFGVWGNVDNEQLKEILQEKEIIEILGYKIGLFHGHGEKKTTIERAYEKFAEDDVDIIVFGHSHQPIICTKNKVLMLNPGSPINKRRERWFSYIILNLTNKGIAVELRFF